MCHYMGQRSTRLFHTGDWDSWKRPELNLKDKFEQEDSGKGRTFQ